MRNKSRGRLRNNSCSPSISYLLRFVVPVVAAWTPENVAVDVPPSVCASERVSSVSRVTAAVPDLENDYRSETRVSIRSVDWCGSKGMMPLQHYHGGALRRNVTSTTQASSELDLKSRLSKSSVFLAENLDGMTREERRRFHSKLKAEARASQSLDPSTDLHILYHDNDLVAVHKPSGILCVPGPRRNPSLADLVHSALKVEIDVDSTVVHRLDMDTSGIVVFALQKEALSRLHDDFRHRRVQKTYQALVCGHVQMPSCAEIEIDLALERDPHHLPFMRVARPKDSTDIIKVVDRNPAACNAKFISQAPKPSLTTASVLSLELLEGHPVTRLELRPHTGRTHQLRVHCAAIGHPIVGDIIYGYNGEGSPSGGLGEWSNIRSGGAGCSNDAQRNIHNLNRPLCLHAQRLCIHHPTSGAPMVFEADPSF